jgi:molecular chaperone GrpE
MQAEGEYFDPNLHEAISQEPNDEFESGQIIDVLRNGYMIGERVLRPASVRVAQ